MSDGLEILLIEDSPADALLTRTALERTGFLAELHHVFSTSEAMAFLSWSQQQKAEATPDVILMDWYLPNDSAIEFLDKIRSEAQYAQLPVIVLTGSSEPRDIQIAYDHHATCFFKKPYNLEGYQNILKRIVQFWPDYPLCEEDECYRGRPS